RRVRGSGDWCGCAVVKKQRPARQRIAGGEDDALERVAPFETHEAIFADADAVAAYPRDTLGVDLRRTIGAQHEIAAPPRQLERKSKAAGAAAVDRERLVAHFPAVAVRAVEDTEPVELPEAGKVGDVVDDAGRDQELARLVLRSVGERDVKACVAAASGVGDSDVADLHGVVLPKLFARNPENLARRNAVAREIAVHRARRGVARL